MQFLKTIRFKLTFWYSSLLLAICLLFVLGINLSLTHYYQQDLLQPVATFGVVPGRNVVFIEKLRDFTPGQQAVLGEIRGQDLREIRVISVIAILPLTILSFVGGYLIAGQMLDPLKQVNSAARELTVQNLGKRQIPHPGVDDEIGELIANFNQMTARLGSSFDLQTQFVQNASHELKTPLAVIQSNLDALLLGDKKLAKDVKAGIQTAKGSIEFMNKLIEDLLLLSLMEEQIKLEQVDVSTILTSAVRDLKTRAKEANVHIQLDLEETPEVKGNKVLLQRALMNILENAIKYGVPQKGQHSITIKTEKYNRYTQVSIQDNGPGIDGQHLDKVFERFYRVDNSRTKTTGGTGLGLAIVKKIIEEVHHGKVSVTSSTKTGTTFLIQLPTKLFNS